MNSMDNRVDQKKLQSGDCPFRRFFVRQAEQDDSTDSEKIYRKYMRSFSDISLRREEMASTSGIYSEASGEEFVRDNGSLLSLQPWIFKRAKCSKREENSNASVCWSFDWGFSHGSPRRINPSSNWIGSKRRQDRFNFRPITSVENIFMPHLCSEKVAVEEYTFNFNSSSQVKDERLSCLIPSSREASRKKLYSLVEQPENRKVNEIGPSISSEKEVSFDQIGGSANEELTTVVGVPYLPPRELRKEERKSRDAMPRSLDTSSSEIFCKISDAPGSFDGILLLLLGIAIGVTSSGLSNKTEVERLKKLLKDNKNLVQDLHEELEMKDSLTVKELGNETDGNEELEHYHLDKSIDAFQNSKWDSAALKMDDHMAKAGGNPETLSQIEAELEAVLESLEQNINACSIGQTTSAFIETTVTSIGEEELHLVAIPTKRNIGQHSFFWGYIVARGLYNSCLVMLNLRCLGIVFDLDETLIVANTMRSFEDMIDALQRKMSSELDIQRVSGMLAEIKRYQDDKSILKQYVDNDQVVENGKVVKAQSEAVPRLSDSHHQLLTRPIIRLHEKNIILTRVNLASESSALRAQLLKDFLPDDLCPLGGQVPMTGQLALHSKDHKSDKEVLETARQVGGISVSTTPDVPFKEMANHCQTLLMGKQQKLSVFVASQEKQEVSQGPYNISLPISLYPNQLQTVFGSVVGVWLTNSTFPGAFHGPSLNVDIHQGTFTEGFLTFIMVIIVLSLKKKDLGSSSKRIWISSVSKVILHLVGSDITGGIMNPATAFGWAYAQGTHVSQEHIFVYWLAPIEATILGVWECSLLINPLRFKVHHGKLCAEFKLD